MKNVTIIGAGTMGSIFCGAVNKWDYDCQTTVANPSPEKLNELKEKYSEIKILNNNVEAVKEADVVILAIKPQVFTQVAEELKGQLEADVLVLSIMAGVKLEDIKSALDVKKVVRAMPNLGSRVNKSMTVWTCMGCHDEDGEMVSSLFTGIGKELCIDDEAMIDKATAVSGSGPGFFFYILEQWLAATQDLGFSEAEAKKLLLATLDGSIELLKKDMQPAKLAKQVASKGGTTEAGYKVLEEHDLKAIWDKVLAAAENKAKELSY